MRMTTLQARRVALAAQGFTRSRPAGVERRHLVSTIRRTGFFQIDSVNVLQRAHHLPLYSRRGPYDLDLFTRAAGRAPRAMFEYWAHEAAYVDVNLWPALVHRMTERSGLWGGPARVAQEHPELIRRVLDEVEARGPITAKALDAIIESEPRERRHWGWNWSLTKNALEYLFSLGHVTSARRTASFEREYDLPERVLPADVLSRPPLATDEASRVLVEHAARAHGIGSLQCFKDYFRMAPAPTRQAITELVDDGVLVPVVIDGWNRAAFLHRDAVVPRAVRARTLISPFDPIVFERARARALFDFDYRIEIYVPEAKRQYGYYVLPFLLGDRLVARVDLKADRAAGILRVPGAWAESHAPEHTAVELAAELQTLAGWLGLADIVVGERGDLARSLRLAVG